MPYDKALQKLLELPKKKLIACRYSDKLYGCFCAVGAIMPSTRPFSGEDIKDLFHDVEIVRAEATELGLTMDELSDLQKFNDFCDHDFTQEEWKDEMSSRYEKAVEFMKNKITRSQP